MAPTAVSPPYVCSDALKHTAIMLSVACIMKGDKPSRMHGRITEALSFMLFGRRRMTARFPERKDSTQKQDTACEITVATAAPRTPI